MWLRRQCVDSASATTSKDDGIITAESIHDDFQSTNICISKMTFWTFIVIIKTYEYFLICTSSYKKLRYIISCRPRDPNGSNIVHLSTNYKSLLITLCCRILPVKRVYRTCGPLWLGWVTLESIQGRIYPMHEKKKEIWLSPMTKAPTPIEKSKKQRDNTKTPPKSSITQRLRTDLGRSVGVTKATQLVWLPRFTGSQPSH